MVWVYGDCCFKNGASVFVCVCVGRGGGPLSAGQERLLDVSVRNGCRGEYLEEKGVQMVNKSFRRSRIDVK